MSIPFLSAGAVILIATAAVHDHEPAPGQALGAAVKGWDVKTLPADQPANNGDFNKGGAHDENDKKDAESGGGAVNVNETAGPTIN